ncbi:MAG TPA: diguanylate cyclase [Noviherbaspirillum sp.]|uniref:diguanylate cyclase n=1 Tax=Noviherbaspirillum sp. TaxID=1926288 RepID=UPI002B47CA77|nr:diguanylate cyclase [Noviherbaspirillum sp.]HJV87391.1 diguanylate cyclase [Noviherbaspirillum sp.]
MRKIFHKLQRVSRVSPSFQLLAIVGALIAVLWGAIWFDLERGREESLARSRNDLTNLALAFAKEIEASVRMIDLTLQDLREHWEADRDRFSAVVRHRQDYLEREVGFQVAVIDADGMLVYSSIDQPSRPVNLGDREHFRVHRLRSSDELFISKPVLGRVSGRWSVQFTRPIYDRNDRFDGVMVLSVSPEYFYRFYRSIALPRDSAVSLMRGNGEILARFPVPDLALGRNITHSPFLDRLSATAGIFQKISQVDGIERLYAWRKLERHQLVVSVGSSMQAISAPYERQKSRSMFAGIVGTALLLLTGYLKLIAIRQRQRADRELATNEERWRVALEAVGDGVWDWNIERNRVDFSDGWKAMLGYRPGEIGSDLEEWKCRVHPEDLPQVMRNINAHFSGETGFFASEQRMQCKDGNWKWVLARGMVIQRYDHGAPRRMVGTHTDISDRKELENALQNLATTDPLTGLCNRRQFLALLEGEMARAVRYPGNNVCVLMADLDHFKRVNDAFGHAVGDAALRHFAQILRSTARQTDFVGRLGGEEFAVVLTETNLEAAELFARRLCSSLRETPLQFDEVTIQMTVSIGVATLEGLDVAAEHVLRRADMALYQAKAAGRNCVVTKCGLSQV